MISRRIGVFNVDKKEHYHLDYLIATEGFAALEDEAAEEPTLQAGKIPDELWSNSPLTREPPQPEDEVDKLADRVEEERLKSMGVIRDLLPEEEHFSVLTTRFVRDWRIKPRKFPDGREEKQWLRRSRLVAREYANSKRDDVHAPTASAHSLRILPLLFLSEKAEECDGGRKMVLGSLDIKDAFLQVDQSEDLQVSTAAGKYRVLKNIPGQRQGAKAWYECLSQFLQENGFQFHAENPCLGKLSDKVWILIHVDDVLFCGEEESVDEFIATLRKRFDVSVNKIFSVGDEFQFLKRTYKLEDGGLSIHPGQYAQDMIESYEARFGPVKKQKLPAGPEIAEVDGSDLLGPEDTALFRSLVGSGIYLAQERFDVAYTIKELASSMSNPTTGSMAKMRKLVGYLKETKGQHCFLGYPERGQGLRTRSDFKWLLETFTDADWSGNKAHRRSTSGGIHVLNGCVIFSSSRGQKVVSLSSSESELNALTSGACDGVYIKNTLEFLTNEEVKHVCLLDNSAARQILCKRGCGRLRHISGKLLWCQDKIATHEMSLTQVGTDFNLADIGTKHLGKARLSALLYWFHMRDGEGQRIGEREAKELEEKAVQRGQVMKVAKYLNRLLILGGLESVAGERFEPNTIEISTQNSFPWGWFLFCAILCAALISGLYLAWKRVKLLENKLEETTTLLRGHLELYERNRRAQNIINEMDRDYCDKLHRGLVMNGGFLEVEDLKEGEEEIQNYLENSNKNLDVLRNNLSRVKYVSEVARRRRTNTPRPARFNVFGEGGIRTTPRTNRTEEPDQEASPEPERQEDEARAIEISTSQIPQTLTGMDVDWLLKKNVFQPMPMNERRIDREIFGAKPDWSRIETRASLRARQEMHRLEELKTAAQGDTRKEAEAKRYMNAVRQFMSLVVQEKPPDPYGMRGWSGEVEL